MLLKPNSSFFLSTLVTFLLSVTDRLTRTNSRDGGLILATVQGATQFPGAGAGVGGGHAGKSLKWLGT